MSRLLRKPLGKTGKVQDISPTDAGWRYVGFAVYRLAAGETASEATGERETMLVIVEGKAGVVADGEDLGVLGSRMSVFERAKPYAVYVPNGAHWSVTAETPCTIAVCTAPGRGGHALRVIRPEDVATLERGKGANKRYIHPIAMEDADVADSLLITEVFTPQGNWSSYPPHRHDGDEGEDMTYLEETYYHRLNPAQGFGVQRVFTEDGEIDETMAVEDGDVVLVPRGHHPVGAPYGSDMYYLNVMAGPVRKWRFKNHPDHDWIYQRDAKP